MDQVGNTGRTTEEPGSEDQQPQGPAGEANATRAACTLAVYRAELEFAPSVATAAKPGTDSADQPVPDGWVAPAGPAQAGHPVPDAGAAPAGPADAGASEAGNSADGYPDGFTGTLALKNLESFDDSTVGETLSRVAHLISFGQALQARLINRMGELFRDDRYTPSERIEPGLAFTLAASECAAILNVPQVTGQRLLTEATSLCTSHTATLAGLEEGRLSYAHAQVVLDQCQNVPAEALPDFEADLLKAAEGQTRSQFSARARRLREKRYPDTITKRHQSAFEQRKVTLDREEDGISCLSAHLRAEDAQQIFTTLSTAARGEQAGGDSRTTDQLRADILAQLLMGGLSSTRAGDARGAGSEGTVSGGGPTRGGRPGRADGTAGRCLTRVGGVGGRGSSRDNEVGGPGGTAGSGGRDCNDAGPDEGIIPRAEIMVLINAETLFGADDQPAELHGYGPISADAARRLARNAAGWTGLAQDPHTGEILGVGRRRKVSAGLRRWLRARDGTCRFPGCRVSTANSDIDHTIDWARGGPTDHGNLEHLCRRHHRFKTLGFWKACQPTPGVIEWTSPTGRVYRTEPFLELGSPHPAVDLGTDHRESAGVWAEHDWKEQGHVEQERADSSQTQQEQAPPF